MTALLALASALFVGGSDFLGGVASRRASAVRVAASTQLVSFLLSLPVAVVAGAERVTRADMLWSITSGLAVAAGVGLFYTALGRGLISLVAPIAAVTGASVPVAYALAQGESPGVAALAGIALALPAIAVVSFAPARPGPALGRVPARSRSRSARGRSSGRSSSVWRRRAARPGSGRYPSRGPLRRCCSLPSWQPGREARRPA